MNWKQWILLIICMALLHYGWQSCSTKQQSPVPPEQPIKMLKGIPY